MPTGAFIDVPARFFDEKSADNCTPQNKLRFSFTTNPNDSIKDLPVQIFLMVLEILLR